MVLLLALLACGAGCFVFRPCEDGDACPAPSDACAEGDPACQIVAVGALRDDCPMGSAAAIDLFAGPLGDGVCECRACDKPGCLVPNVRAYPPNPMDGMCLNQCSGSAAVAASMLGSSTCAKASSPLSSSCFYVEQPVPSCAPAVSLGTVKPAYKLKKKLCVPDSACKTLACAQGPAEANLCLLYETSPSACPPGFPARSAWSGSYAGGACSCSCSLQSSQSQCASGGVVTAYMDATCSSVGTPLSAECAAGPKMPAALYLRSSYVPAATDSCTAVGKIDTKPSVSDPVFLCCQKQL